MPGSLLPWSRAARAALPPGSAPAVVVPPPVERSGDLPWRRDPVAVAYTPDVKAKGLDLVCAAWAAARIPGARLRVFGVERDAALAHLARSGTPVPENAEFLGKRPAAEFRAALRGALAYAGGARWEDFGQAPLEALADGALLATVPSGGPFEALALARELAPALVAPSLEPEGLAAALRAAFSLHEDDAHAYRQRAAGHARALPPRDDPAGRGGQGRAGPAALSSAAPSDRAQHRALPRLRVGLQRMALGHLRGCPRPGARAAPSRAPAGRSAAAIAGGVARVDEQGVLALDRHIPGRARRAGCTAAPGRPRLPRASSRRTARRCSRARARRPGRRAPAARRAARSRRIRTAAPERSRRGAQPALERARPGQHQLGLAVGEARCRERADQRLEVLVRHEPAHAQHPHRARGPLAVRPLQERPRGPRSAARPRPGLRIDSDPPQALAPL